MVAKFAFRFTSPNFGIAIAARIPMMRQTIISSISVKPRLREFMAGSGGRSGTHTENSPCARYMKGNDNASAVPDVTPDAAASYTIGRQVTHTLLPRFAALCRTLQSRTLMHRGDAAIRLSFPAN